MLDNIILNKISIIQNCLKRIQEEYFGHEKELEYNYTKQDSIILNLQRACEAAIDLGTRLIRLKKLDLPQQSRDIFTILQKHQYITLEISQQMQAMVGFRNVAVHDYQKMSLVIVQAILQNHLSDFQDFTQAIQKAAAE